MLTLSEFFMSRVLLRRLLDELCLVSDQLIGLMCILRHSLWRLCQKGTLVWRERQCSVRSLWKVWRLRFGQPYRVMAHSNTAMQKKGQLKRLVRCYITDEPVHNKISVIWREWYSRRMNWFQGVMEEALSYQWDDMYDVSCLSSYVVT